MNNIDRLIEAVEAGDVSMNQCASAFPSGSAYDVCTWHHAWAAYNGSLDAALALHEALLPGCGWKTQKLLCNDYYTAEVWGEYAYSEESGSAQNPARAWLLAILRAYRSVQA